METPTELAQRFRLRRTTPRDRDSLTAMYRRFEPKGASLGLPPRRDFEHWLDTLGAYSNFVIVEEERVVAHAVLCPQGDSGEMAIFVEQGYRGRGLGKKLLSELVREAQRLGLRRVWGLTELDNAPMLRLAYSLGFVPGDDPYEFTLNLGDKPQASPVDTLAA